MALRRHITLNSFTPVTAGQRTTLDVPADGTYYDIVLEYKESGALVSVADMKVAIEEIVLKINGLAVRRLTATQLLAINALRGVANQDGYLPIYFGEPWAANPASQDALAWGMGDVETFQIEVVVASGRTSPSLVAFATKTNELRALGAIKKMQQYVIPVSATGIHNHQNFPKSDSYVALHNFSSDIDDIQVKVDNVEIFDLEDSQNDQHLTNLPDITPQSGVFSVLFNETGRIEDLLPMVVSLDEKRARPVQSFQVDYNMSAATAFTVVTETIGAVRQ